MFKILLAFLLTTAIAKPTEDDLFELSIVHFNDFHARFDETSWQSGQCHDVSTCIGGFSRLYEEIDHLVHAKDNTLLLNAGDNYQGTLYYTLGKWNITLQFMNMLPLDATVPGNHDFDDDIAGIVPFIKNLKSPIICANIDDSEEPDFQGIYTKSTIIEKNGKKIGIIGVIYSKTNEITSPGKLKFLPESPSVNAEAERLVAEEGVFTNIVLSHVGYDIDQQIAANSTGKIGLIVGGHSHTFLYSGEKPPGPDTPAGPYPTIVKNQDNKNVLIVQAAAYTKYLGNISVFYDSNGDVADYSGSPIFLDTDLPKDDEVNEELQPWIVKVNASGNVVIGSSRVLLSMAECYTAECTLGNFITDTYISAYINDAPNNSWTKAAIAFINAGGLRTDINIGNITYNDLITSQPFANTVDYGEIQGKYIKEVLEFGAQNYTNQRITSDASILQLSGLHVVYNLTRPVGDRAQTIKVRCKECLVPIYEDLDLDATYSIVLNSFLRQGGDGYKIFTDRLENVLIGNTDVDIIEQYLQAKSPVFEEIEGRITIISDRKLKSVGSN